MSTRRTKRRREAANACDELRKILTKDPSPKPIRRMDSEGSQGMYIQIDEYSKENDNDISNHNQIINQDKEDKEDNDQQ